MPLQQIISDITKDGVLYAVVLTEACAADKTINIHVLQGKNPKGYISLFMKFNLQNSVCHVKSAGYFG